MITTQVFASLPRVAQAGEEPAELGIDAEQALVVQVAEATGDGVQLRLSLGPMLRVGGVGAWAARQPSPGPAFVLVGGGPCQNRPMALGGRHVGAVHVHEIQEEEERPEPLGGVPASSQSRPLAAISLAGCLQSKG